MSNEITGFLASARKKLSDLNGISGQKERVMAPFVRDKLLEFCDQDAEFAQAVAQGKPFSECMIAVTHGVGNHISDIEAYSKAVGFYFPGAKIRVVMEIDLIGDAAGESIQPAPAKKLDIINLEDFL